MIQGHGGRLRDVVGFLFAKHRYLYNLVTQGQHLGLQAFDLPADDKRQLLRRLKVWQDCRAGRLLESGNLVTLLS